MERHRKQTSSPLQRPNTVTTCREKIAVCSGSHTININGRNGELLDTEHVAYRVVTDS